MKFEIDISGLLSPILLLALSVCLSCPSFSVSPLIPAHYFSLLVFSELGGQRTRYTDLLLCLIFALVLSADVIIRVSDIKSNCWRNLTKFRQFLITLYMYLYIYTYTIAYTSACIVAILVDASFSTLTNLYFRLLDRRRERALLYNTVL